MQTLRPRLSARAMELWAVMSECRLRPGATYAFPRKAVAKRCQTNEAQAFWVVQELCEAGLVKYQGAFVSKDKDDCGMVWYRLQLQVRALTIDELMAGVL